MSARHSTSPGAEPGEVHPTLMTPAAAPTNFAVHTRRFPETIIALSGELDLATVEQLKAVLDRLDFSSARRVVLDLEQLKFIDLTGLRAILRLHRTCLEESVTLTIKRGPRAVHRLFELTRTDRLLPFVTC